MPKRRKTRILVVLVLLTSVGTLCLAMVTLALMGRPLSSTTMASSTPDLAPNWWKRGSFGETHSEGGQGSCKRFRRPLHPSRSVKRYDWLRPAGNRSQVVVRLEVMREN
jgi:hypothetical protein